MNIFALPGHKIKTTAERIETAGFFTRTDGLEPEKEYTVKETIPGKVLTRVVLSEMPLREFNADLFIDVDKQPEEKDREHPYYKYFHQ